MSDNLDNSASSETGESQDALDVLNADDSSTTDESTTDETTETDETSEKLETKSSETDFDEELDDKTEDENQDEITRPSWKTLKESKAFQNLPKPQQEEFREVFHRERAFSEVFPTVDEAKIAADKSNSFDWFANEIGNGNVSALVENLTPEELGLFSQNVLNSIRSTDENAFKIATAPIITDILYGAVEFARAHEDKNLEASAYNIAKLLFGVKFGQLPPRGENGRANPQVEAEKNRFIAETNKLALRERGRFLESADKSIKVRLEKEILSGLSDVESEYTKKSILRDTIDEVKSLLNNDKGFNEQMKRIISQAEKAGYAPEHMTRVISAYLNRAKTIAARSRAKFKTSATGKQSTKRAEDKNNRVEGTGKETKGTGINLKGAEKRNFYRGKTDLDIINS